MRIELPLSALGLFSGDTLAWLIGEREFLEQEPTPDSRILGRTSDTPAISMSSIGKLNQSELRLGPRVWWSDDMMQDPRYISYLGKPVRSKAKFVLGDLGPSSIRIKIDIKETYLAIDQSIKASKWIHHGTNGQTQFTSQRVPPLSWKVETPLQKSNEFWMEVISNFMGPIPSSFGIPSQNFPLSKPMVGYVGFKPFNRIIKGIYTEKHPTPGDDVSSWFIITVPVVKGSKPLGLFGWVDLCSGQVDEASLVNFSKYDINLVNEAVC